MGTVVHHNRERNRYELYDDDALIGVAEYSDAGSGQDVFHHTEIASHLRGQGYGEVLVREALDHVRRAGRTVVPQCWYVAQFIDEHPEYGDLRAA